MTLYFLANFNLSIDSIAALDDFLIFIKHLMTLFGSLVILSGSLLVACQFVYRFVYLRGDELLNFDMARIGLTRSIILGLEFIIAADVIQTTTTPDYYAVGILAAIALIRAFLNYSLNRDLIDLTQREERERERLSTIHQSKI
ncbi:MAG: DUF1622 domain-containing protein [Parachlamydiaceae bacterium]